jgi:RNA polymerase sigma factor for flagellar operon FliA
VERDEVASWGVLGLIRAIERFDFGVGVQFETYAVASIRSVVLDELRKLDWAPRSLRRRQRDITEAREALEVLLSRVPTHDEVGERLGLTGAEVRKALAATEASYAKSLDEMALTDQWWANEGGTRADRLTGGLTPHEARMTSLIGETAKALISDLTAQEQLILALYYYHGMTLAEAGRVAGIPESRASQVHSRVVTRIRAELADLLRPEDGQSSR